MIKKIILICLSAILCIGFIGCDSNEEPEPVQLSNVFWEDNSILYTFTLGDASYLMNANLPNDLIYNGYLNNIDDVGMLVKMGYNSSDAPAVYCQISEEKVSAVKSYELNGYLTINIKFKLMDGRVGEYNFDKLTENSDFQWLGFPIQTSPEKLKEILGEPTGIEKNDNDTISALIYKDETSGNVNRMLRIDFLGYNIREIQLIRKVG